MILVPVTPEHGLAYHAVHEQGFASLRNQSNNLRPPLSPPPPPPPGPPFTPLTVRRTVRRREGSRVFIALPLDVSVRVLDVSARVLDVLYVYLMLEYVYWSVDFTLD